MLALPERGGDRFGRSTRAASNTQRGGLTVAGKEHGGTTARGHFTYRRLRSSSGPPPGTPAFGIGGSVADSVYTRHRRPFAGVDTRRTEREGVESSGARRTHSNGGKQDLDPPSHPLLLSRVQLGHVSFLPRIVLFELVRRLAGGVQP